MLVSGAPSYSQSDAAARAEPRETLNAMLNYIREQRELAFNTTTRLSGVISRRAEFQFHLRQPNLLRATLKENGKETDYISDGSLMTIYRPSDNRHITVRAKDSMIATMNVAAGLTSLMGRVLQFLWVADLADEHSKVSTLAPIRVNNAECTGVRLDRFEEIFEVWIRKTGAPLPCKLISRRLDGAGAITQTNIFTWLEPPAPSDDAFKFVPGKSSGLRSGADSGFAAAE
jgi:hypothetical protein